MGHYIPPVGVTYNILIEKEATEPNDKHCLLVSSASRLSGLLIYSENGYDK
jgi:hypothetical protein